MIAPKPEPRADKVSLWQYLRLFRKDILSAQPARLYRAWMAEFRTPFFRSFLINQPDLIREVLKDRAPSFPKSDRIGEGLRPLLGNSVFLTNGEVWQRQRRIIDPAFEGGRIKATYPAMLAAAQAAVERLEKQDGVVDIEPIASRAAADIIFRTLFSIPITHHLAAQVFSEFQAYQRSQPIVNMAAFVPVPRWVPRFHRRKTKSSARNIRALITTLTQNRMAEIEAGNAPDDLATKIMTTRDPVTGQGFDAPEMVDQVAIFFLAGHETSAAALSWALYLLAAYPKVQKRVVAEAATLSVAPTFSELSKLSFTRDVFRETLRLYPPVPMMVRETTATETFRDRAVPKGSQIVISPWHLHRHERLWDEPDLFDPDRFQTERGKDCLRTAFLPFSSGPRVCPGAGFAMTEAVLMLALLVRRFKFAPAPGNAPVPVAHLTVRSKDGIRLVVEPRSA